jgi:hypothetical protein
VYFFIYFKVLLSYYMSSIMTRILWFVLVFLLGLLLNSGKFQKFSIFKYVFLSHYTSLILLVQFKRISNETWFGIIPKYKYVYKQSYKDTATSEYDRVSNKNKTSIRKIFLIHLDGIQIPIMDFLPISHRLCLLFINVS